MLACLQDMVFILLALTNGTYGMDALNFRELETHTFTARGEVLHFDFTQQKQPNLSFNKSSNNSKFECFLSLHQNITLKALSRGFGQYLITVIYKLLSVII